MLSVEGGGARVVSPGVKECQSAADLPGDGSPLTGVHPSFSLTNLRPDAFRPDVSGIAWYPDGSAAVLTWGAAQTSSNGKLYKVTNLQGDTSAANVTYTEIASGLPEPQGVAVVDGATYVSTKTGLDKLVDANGDGFFEGRDRLTSWPYANTFHEFAFGLPYRDGYFYVALASALDRAGVTLVPQPSAERGTIAKVNKDTGAVQYIAGGLRTPNGINWGPNGKLLVTDNQGGWVPTSKLVQIEEGGFYNTPTTWADPVTGAMVNGRFDNQPVTPPVVWMPHGEISNSPSTPVVMEEGLFAGQLAIGDVTYGGVQRVFLEQVDGKLQGALYRMTQGLEAGINELALGPDGDLYLGGIGYDGNWNQPGKLRYGLQKLRANDTVTMDILKTEITETGFKLTYTKPLSEQTRTNLAAKYQVQQWRYNPTAAYGGPKLDQEGLGVDGATVSADGKTVSLTVAGVKPGRVVHIRSPRPFSAADGEQLWSTEVWYTANAVPGYQSPADQGYYEAEEATILGGASIASEHSKYSGSGFVANMTTVGSGVTFTVNAAQAGPQPVHVRYSNGPNPSVKTKIVSLIVNGTEVDPLSLPSTTDWKTWAFATRELNLNAGSNTITIRYDTGDDGWVNVDLLKVGTDRDICSPQAPGAGYSSLFDGTLDSLTGWRHASGGSFARQPDCSLKTVGDIGMLWWPGERFDKYSLKLDWKLPGDDNSGIFVGFPDPGNDWNVAFTRGHEVQIDATDDADSTTGAIYNYSAPDAAARDAALNPPGQWNAYEIIVEGQRIQVFLNGVKINDFTNTDPNRMTVPGFIGIQNHGAGDDVFFRNVRLRKLDQGGNAAPVIETATATPASGTAPLAVSFAATATDPDGDALTYAWDLDGDATFETSGRTASRTYDTAGLYSPAVRVTDPDGASATRTLAVTVQGGSDDRGAGYGRRPRPRGARAEPRSVCEPRGVHAGCRSRLHGIARRDRHVLRSRCGALGARSERERHRQTRQRRLGPPAATAVPCGQRAVCSAEPLRRVAAPDPVRDACRPATSDDRCQAVDRRNRLAAGWRLRQDAGLHAHDNDPVAPRLERRLGSAGAPTAVTSSASTRAASRSANAASLIWRSCSSKLTSVPAISARSASLSAARARGSSNGPSVTSSAETPRRGTSTLVGPFAARSLRPIAAPITAASSVVTRMSVLAAVWAYSRRFRNRSGTESGGPKLAMSVAPSETTWGTPADAAASSRCGPAARMPPRISSAHSVVVTSSTASTTPLATRRSIMRPPAPVAWKIKTSQPAASSCCFARWTHGVVTPNIVAATTGAAVRLAAGSAAAPSAMPARASAARA